MCCSRLLFFFSFILLLPVAPTAQYCYQSGNYTRNSTYRANLNSLLASMSSNTQIDYGFYNFSAGENADKVNAIALCRGDISPDDCRGCVNASSHDLLRSCPYQKEAIKGDGRCTVRYSDRSIFGVMEVSPIFAFYNTGNVSDVEGFNRVLGQLLDRLRNRAALGNSTRKFALGSESAPNFPTLYALMECTPDLDWLECNNCLLQAASYIPQCCDGKQGGRYITPSCNLRFETYVFYDPAAESPPPSPSPSSPREQPASPPPGQPLPPTHGPPYCNQSGNYPSNSTYRENLNSLLASMSSNTQIDYGFYNFSVGENADKVNAIALCRGDISPDDCRSCIKASSLDLLQSCPNQKEAIIWYDKCSLRYSNRLIFGVMEEKPLIASYKTGNGLDVEGFNKVLIPLLDRLRNGAALGNSTRKFALGSESAPNFQTIYALVECTPDLGWRECNNCLQPATGFITESVNGTQGGKWLTPNCNLRYET